MPGQVLSQRDKKDTAGVGSIDIISAFKPTLRDPIKIQFTAATPLPDSSRPKLAYRIPNQELSISYQPGTLKPLAYQSDSNKGFSPAQYVKLGYGSLQNPFLSVGLEFGDRSPLRFYGEHQSASGRLSYQDYSVNSGQLLWQKADRHQGEWLTAVSVDRQVYYKYGFDRSRPQPILDSLRQVFHQFGFQLAYRGKSPARTGWVLAPVLDWKINADGFGNRDMNAQLFVPIEYTFHDRISLHLNGLVHWGRIRPEGKATFDQSVYSLHSSLRFDWPKWGLHAGFRPSWDAAGVHLYPDVQFFWRRSEKPWLFRIQWTGELARTGYCELYTVNPWLWMPDQWRNTGRIDRSLLGQYNRRAHWVYEIQLGYATLQNAFLFVNDTSTTGDGRSFRTLYADRIQNLYAKGKLTYREADRWLVRAEAGWNNYHGIRGAEKPWGLLPFEWNLHAMHRFQNRLRVQADLYSWFAPYFLSKSGLPSRTDGAFDLNLGAQMPITKRIQGWLQFNNLFNQLYSRWSQYPSYGFHFVGGVVFSLDKSIP